MYKLKLKKISTSPTGWTRKFKVSSDLPSKLALYRRLGYEFENLNDYSDPLKIGNNGLSYEMNLKLIDFIIEFE